MSAPRISPLYDDDGVSPLTSRSTSPDSVYMSEEEYRIPRRVIPPPIQLPELEKKYLSQLEQHYNQYNQSVESIRFITNNFINDLPNLKHILKNDKAAIECYNNILGGFINVDVFVDDTEIKLIDMIMKSAKIRIQNVYRIKRIRRHTIGGKIKTRKNQKTKRIKKSNKSKTHSKKNGGKKIKTRRSRHP